MGRSPSCVCGECQKCIRRIRAKEAYQSLTTEERRDLVSRRDPAKAKAADRSRYYRDKEKRLAASASYARSNPEKVSEIKRRWAERNPDKRAAHIVLGNAVRKGSVVKGPCEVCGSTGRVHGHHDDYAKPFEVRWLCPQHHADERRK